MSLIKGIYAASMSVLNDNLTLNIAKTIKHAENLIEEGCHGVAIFGSTGQAQLISVSEKIELLNDLSKSKYNEKFIGISGLDLINEKSKVARFFIVIGKKELWGKGIGLGVIRSIVKYGFHELKLRKINSDFLIPNEGVKIIHEKAGFKHEGFLRKDSFRNNNWIDREIVSIFPDELIKIEDKQ